MAKKDAHVREGGASMPTLMTTKQFAYFIGKSARWVRKACEDDVILAKQKVGQGWIIAQDTLLRPRALRGMDGYLIDVGLPKEKIIGKTYVVPLPPEPYTPKGNPNGNPKRKITLVGWPRIRKQLDMGRDRIYQKTGVHPDTQRKLESLEPVTSEVAWKLAYSLDVEIEDLLRR